jgi:hypothetical protein
MLITALQDRVVRDKSGEHRLAAVRSPENVLRAARVTLFACAALQRRSCVFAIQFGNETGANLRWANCLTFVCIGAITESFCIHYGDHSQHAALSFRMTLRQER